MDDAPVQGPAIDEIVAALSRKPNGSGGYQTVRQLVARTGFSDTTIRTVLQRLHEEGRLDVKFVRRSNIAGRQQAIPAYRLKSPSEPDSSHRSTRSE